MRMYTIQELTKKKIAILLPTEEEYKIFEYYVESNEIRSCILCYDGWNEYKNYTCMAYSALGFMLYSKKEKKKFSIKKFIRLEQLIMEDTPEKQDKKLKEGFASIDEFLYYLISNDIIEKRNIVSIPSASGDPLIEFMTSSDKFKFFQRLNGHKINIGDLVVNGFSFKHTGAELFLVAIELTEVQNLEDETVIIPNINPIHFLEKSQEESKIKTFDKFAEIEGVASNYIGIDNFYPKEALIIEINYTNGENDYLEYKTKKTRDSDYKKLLEVKNNGKRKV